MLVAGAGCGYSAMLRANVADLTLRHTQVVQGEVEKIVEMCRAADSLGEPDSRLPVMIQAAAEESRVHLWRIESLQTAAVDDWGAVAPDKQLELDSDAETAVAMQYAGFAGSRATSFTRLFWANAAAAVKAAWATVEAVGSAAQSLVRWIIIVGLTVSTMSGVVAIAHWLRARSRERAALALEDSLEKAKTKMTREEFLQILPVEPKARKAIVAIRERGKLRRAVNGRRSVNANDQAVSG